MRSLLGFGFAAVFLLSGSAVPLNAGVQASGAQSPPMLRIPPPTANRQHPKRARAVNYDGYVEIPDWAREAGHNGVVTVRALVGPDGKATGVEVVTSSNSSAIDAAAVEEALALRYEPATSGNGEPTVGHFDMQFRYGQSTTPRGESYGAYTCKAMISELRWYSAANPETADFFNPQSRYTRLVVWQRRRDQPRMTVKEADESERQRLPMWEALVERCESNPDSLFVDQMEDRAEFLEEFAS